MTKSTVPTASLTLKSATAIPSLTPGPSLSKMVPVPRGLTMFTRGVELLLIVRDKFSVGSNNRSSTILTPISSASPFPVPAGKVNVPEISLTP